MDLEKTWIILQLGAEGYKGEWLHFNCGGCGKEMFWNYSSYMLHRRELERVGATRLSCVGCDKVLLDMEVMG